MPAIVRIPVESSLATGSVNVWHYSIPNASPITEVSEAIDQLDTFYAAIAGELTPQTFTIGARCVTVDQTPNVVIAGGVETTVATGSGVAVLSAAAVLSLQTNIVGGSKRGRVYLGPLDLAAIGADGRSVNATTRSNITAAAGPLLVATASGARTVIWSRKLLSATTVTGVSTAAVLGSQRRRLR